MSKPVLKSSSLPERRDRYWGDIEEKKPSKYSLYPLGNEPLTQTPSVPRLFASLLSRAASSVDRSASSIAFAS